jgi:hypothetical protein
VLLSDGIRAGVKIFSYALLSGHPDALAAFVEFQAVVFADQVLALKIAHRKRQEAMGAAVLEAGDRSVHLAVQHDGLAADGARKRRVLDFGVPSDGVPIIPKEHLRFSLIELVS